MRRVKPYGHLGRTTICTTQATMRESINLWAPEWEDDTTPRTDRPVRFQFRQWREDVDARPNAGPVVRRAASRIVA